MGETVHVVIDLARIQSNMLRDEGGSLTVGQIRNWLVSVGFKPDSHGPGWIGDREALRSLDASEFVRALTKPPVAVRSRPRMRHGRGPLN